MQRVCLPKSGTDDRQFGPGQGCGTVVLGLLRYSRAEAPSTSGEDPRGAWGTHPILRLPMLVVGIRDGTTPLGVNRNCVTEDDDVLFIPLCSRCVAGLTVTHSALKDGSWEKRRERFRVL